jgi:magnesium transporter
MEPATAAWPPSVRVSEAIAHVRTLSRQRHITYIYVVDPQHRLIGVVTMRDLLLQPEDAALGDFMLRHPFSLPVELPVLDAMRLVLDKHYPCYPVCDEAGRLVGQVWGHRLAAVERFELSAQAGTMVGVAKEESTATPWTRSLFFRQPWLQLNLLTGFLAAGVVSYYELTIEKIVLLAVFLPVMTGQAANTGCQALAVAIRAMTLGELKRGGGKRLILKEMILGSANGVLVGLTAAAGIFAYASMQDTAESPLVLAGVLFVAMVGACVFSGVFGALTPLALRKCGADPATASSIVLTTFTDVVSMGLFLAIATWWLM